MHRDHLKLNWKKKQLLILSRDDKKTPLQKLILMMQFTKPFTIDEELLLDNIHLLEQSQNETKGLKSLVESMHENYGMLESADSETELKILDCLDGIQKAFDSLEELEGMIPASFYKDVDKEELFRRRFDKIFYDEEFDAADPELAQILKDLTLDDCVKLNDDEYM